MRGLITNNPGVVVFRDTMMIYTSSRTLIIPSRPRHVLACVPWIRDLDCRLLLDHLRS